MIYQILFYLTVIAIIGDCIAAAWLLLRRPLKPFVRLLLGSLLVFEVFASIGHVEATAGHLPHFWAWFLNLENELNLGTLFSSTQLIAVAVCALLIALLVPNLRRIQRGYWTFMFLAFTFLGIDEFYSIHETLGGRFETDAWRIPYAVFGVSLVVITVLVFWFTYRRRFRTFALIFLGLALLGVAGVLVEKLVTDGFVDANTHFSWLYMFEEVGEMVGATFVLSGLAIYASEQMPVPRWRGAKRMLLGLPAIWIVWLLFAIFLQPRFEARFMATPVNIQYGSGVRLIAYHLDTSVVQPDGYVPLTLYWETDQPLTENYSLSVHALTHPGIESVAQSDDLDAGPIKSDAWLPHLVMRRTVELQMPDTLEAPYSYWLMVRLWYGPWPLGRPWQDTTGVPITTSPVKPLLTNDAVILDHVVALPLTAQKAAATPITYKFPSDGELLTGYTLPTAPVSETLPVTFQWSAVQRDQRDLTQFFHLIPRNGGDPIVRDRQPFDGNFPTSDWQPGMNVVDPWTPTFDATAADGEYDVYTGFYDPDTRERVPVTDASGQPQQDNEIYLGTIQRKTR